MRKVAFYTLGCKLNFSETSSISRSFEEKGYKKVEFGWFIHLGTSGIGVPMVGNDDEKGVFVPGAGFCFFHKPANGTVGVVERA